MLELQLRALRYPHCPLDQSNQEAVRKLVVWLENMKIREYKLEDRKGLVDVSSATWDVAFAKYLKDLDCPLPPTDITATLQWLVALAVNLEYEDNADKLGLRTAPTSAAATSTSAPAAAVAGGAAGGAKAGGHAAAAGSKEHAFSDLTDPAVVAALRQLVAAAQVESSSCSATAAGGAGGHGGGGGLARAVQVAAERLVCQVAPALHADAWSKGRPATQALAHVPLGFEVEDEALRTAATVLRLRYIQDLRRLQSQIDHAVVEMQEYTANPKTDSSLGKVGR